MISIFTMITKPEKRQDQWRESIANFTEFADEVVIVCGDKSDLKLDFPNKDKIKLVYNKWRSDDYMIYGEQYKIGFENTTGSWCIKADIDYLFHENDWEDIRNCLESSDEDVLFMAKKQFILADRFKVKALMPIVFKGKLRGRVKFDSGGDYTWPRIDGQDVTDKSKSVCKKEYVVIGDNVTDEQIRKRLPDVIEKNDEVYTLNRRICVFNYDMCFKDKKTIGREFLKQSRARFEKTGSDWGQTEKDALEYFVGMQRGRLKQGWAMMELDKHPKHIKDKVKNLKLDQLGYSLFGGFK